jgi:hypothetical protein
VALHLGFAAIPSTAGLCPVAVRWTLGNRNAPLLRGRGAIEVRETFHDFRLRRVVSRDAPRTTLGDRLRHRPCSRAHSAGNIRRGRHSWRTRIREFAAARPRAISRVLLACGPLSPPETGLSAGRLSARRGEFEAADEQPHTRLAAMACSPGHLCAGPPHAMRGFLQAVASIYKPVMSVPRGTSAGPPFPRAPGSLPLRG